MIGFFRFTPKAGIGECRGGVCPIGRLGRGRFVGLDVVMADEAGVGF